MELTLAEVRDGRGGHPGLGPDSDHDVVGRHRHPGELHTEDTRIFYRYHFLAERDVLVLAAGPFHVVPEFLPGHGVELRVDVVVKAAGLVQVRDE